MAFKDSIAPFGEPGKLTISTAPQVPARLRDKGAKRVAFRPSLRIISPMPGISRSRMARVASGVTSRSGDAGSARGENQIHAPVMGPRGQLGRNGGDVVGNHASGCTCQPKLVDPLPESLPGYDPHECRWPRNR